MCFFAVVDYLSYRFQRGPYSRRKLEAEGWFLADESSLDMLGTVRNGDMLFSQPINSFMSWVVMYFQGGPGSHVGMLTDQGTIVEAVTAGVVERSASAYFDGKHYLKIGRHRQMNEDSGKKAVFFMRSHIGKKYGWGKAVSLGLHILIGNHWDWRSRITIDVLFFLATAWLVAYKVSSLRWAIPAVGILYASLVFIIRLRPHTSPIETAITGRWPQSCL